MAKLAGASEREINEAIRWQRSRATGAFLNGVQIDEAAFKRGTERVVKSAKKSMAARKGEAAPTKVAKAGQ